MQKLFIIIVLLLMNESKGGRGKKLRLKSIYNPIIMQATWTTFLGLRFGTGRPLTTSVIYG
jgi:hypothetical protein